MQALIVTPNPNPTESLLGYILRVSESNGYTSPIAILEYAGMEYRDIRRFHIATEKLAAVLNKPPSMLTPLSNISKLENSIVGLKILNHHFGDKQISRYIRLNKPAICPDCVSVFGFIDAFWDCSLAVACPFHRRVPISLCNDCGTALKWVRSNLFNCKCGNSLCQPDLFSPPSEAVLEMMKFLWARLHDEPTNSLENLCGLPVAALEKLSLKSFVHLVDALARLVTNERAIENLPKLEVVEKAGQLLMNWPHNFNALLDDIKAKRIELLGNGISFSRCFRLIYQTLLQSFADDDVEFIREAYENYSLHHWDGPKSKPKSKSKESARFISLREMAVKVGVAPTTIKRLIAKGMLNLKKVSSQSHTRWLLDTEQFQMPESIDSNTMDSKAASILIGIPPKVLLHLRKTGHYKINHLFLHKDSFSELDLLSFREQLFASCDRQLDESDDKKSLLSLEHVLQRRSFKSKTGKGDFVAAYLDKKLIPAGKTGDSFSEIFFYKRDVIAFQNECRDDFSKKNGVITIGKAEKLLGIGPHGIHALIDAGIITRSENENIYSLDRRSIELFANQYIGLAGLAKTLKTTTPRLKKLCKQNSISILTFEGLNGRKPQFISISDREKLITASDLHPPYRCKNPGILTHTNSVATCERYLQELRANNQNLPMKIDTYDKTQVSRACGFSRDVIYGNKKVKKMLDEYLAEYKERNSLIAFPSDRLKQYIDQLKATNSMPPMWSGKINRLSIARICKFKRQLLYRDPVVIELLNNLENSLNES